MMQEFVQSIEKLVEDAMMDIHTAVPAKFLDYDPASNMATVQPIANFHAENGKKIPYPIISGVPVAILKAGSCEIGLPVSPGDTCLLVFSETDISPAVGMAEEDIPMRFDLTNAMAIPGIGPYTTDAGSVAKAENALVVRNGETVLKVLEDGVEIKGNLKVSGTINGTIEGGTG